MGEATDYYQIHARRDFDRARRRAFVQEMLALITRRSVDLLPFEEVEEKLHLRHKTYRGLQEIPLDKVAGSVGRYHDFTRTFLPRRARLRERWQRTDQLARYSGFPPIEVYKVGDVYFVRDGNHRVSVARQLGASTIEAYVWEYLTRVPLAPDIDLDSLLIKEEYVEFLERTLMDRVRPQQHVEFTVPGRYRELEAQMAAHRLLMSQERGKEVPYEEAVADWYDHIYVPLVEAIREADVLKKCPRPHRGRLLCLDHALPPRIGRTVRTGGAAG